MTDLTGAVWHEGTCRGGNGGNCVEVAIVGVGDSMGVTGWSLTFSPPGWAGVVTAAQCGGLVR